VVGVEDIHASEAAFHAEAGENDFFAEGTGSGDDSFGGHAFDNAIAALLEIFDEGVAEAADDEDRGPAFAPCGKLSHSGVFHATLRAGIILLMKTLHVSRKLRIVFSALMIGLWACADALSAEAATPSVQIYGPASAAGQKDTIENVVVKADAELRQRYGLELPSALTIVLTGREGLARFVPGDERIRYDGVALAWKNTVAVDIESGSVINLVTVLRHELFHLAAAPADLPRWFDEGMAMMFSGDLFPVGGEQNEMSASPPTDVTPPAASLDYLFASPDGRNVRRAYIDSDLLVGKMVEIAGGARIRQLLEKRVKAPEKPFEVVLKEVTGIDVDALYRQIDAERKPSGIWRVIRFFGSFSVFAYIAIVLVVGGIIKRKRLRELLMRGREPYDGEGDGTAG